MATKKKAKTGSSKGKRAAAKAYVLKSTASKSSRKVSKTQGQVYVVQKAGVKATRSHVTKKATAHEIRNSIGISDKTRSGAKSLLRMLERDGLISKV